MTFGFMTHPARQGFRLILTLEDARLQELHEAHVDNLCDIPVRDHHAPAATTTNMAQT